MARQGFHVDVGQIAPRRMRNARGHTGSPRQRRRKKCGSLRKTAGKGRHPPGGTSTSHARISWPDVVRMGINAGSTMTPLLLVPRRAPQASDLPIASSRSPVGHHAGYPRQFWWRAGVVTPRVLRPRRKDRKMRSRRKRMTKDKVRMQRRS